MRNRKKKKIEMLYISKGIAGISSYIKDEEVAKYLLYSGMYLNKETLFTLYRYVSDFDKEVILKKLDKMDNDYSVPFELILKVINSEDSIKRVKRLRKELYNTRNFGEIYNYFRNYNTGEDEEFRDVLASDISYALAAISYLERNDLKAYVRDIDVDYIEKIILKDRNASVLENYISNYKIHNNKEMEKILFQIGNPKLIYLYILKGNYSKDFNKENAIIFIESSGDLELIIKTAIYLKPENLSNINVYDFFLSIGLIDLQKFDKKELIDDLYKKNF